MDGVEIESKHFELNIIRQSVYIIYQLGILLR